MLFPDTVPPQQPPAVIPAVCTITTPRDSVTADCTVVAVTEGRSTGIGFMFSARLSIQFLGVMEDGGLVVSHISLNDGAVTPVGEIGGGACAVVGRSIACRAPGVVVTARAL